MLYSDPQPTIETHPLIGDPWQKKKRNDVSAPIVDEQAKAGQDENTYRYPVAKAVLASKYVKKFASEYAAAGFALIAACLAPLTKNFFLGDGP